MARKSTNHRCVYLVMVSIWALNSACDDPEVSPAFCGDGYIQVANFETCDDGNTIDGDGCQSNCLLARCGDGIVDAGEQCDGRYTTRTCDADCTRAVCGDGIINEAADEKCDDGNNIDGDGCQSNCLYPRCGDGIVDNGEQCDDGAESALCNWDCTRAACGDGIINVKAGETCDDGNIIDGDSCPKYCVLPICGDGVLDAAFGEDCDDGNNRGGDSCPANCSLSTLRVFAGRNQSCVVDGALYCWGDNEAGQLGTGTVEMIGDDELPYTVAEMPVAVDDSATTIKVALGGLHTCAVLDNQTAKCWGDNFWGQLGQGNTINVDEGRLPRDVPAIELSQDPDAQVTDIAAGYEHSCAIYSDRFGVGQVKCWGRNFSGELGYGDDRRVGDDPGELASVDSLRLGGPAIQLVAGLFHTCALLADGAVRCWGLNSFGQLGVASTRIIGDNEHPDELPPVALGGAVTQLFAGVWHNCALLDSGDVRCWGSNSVGQLGTGTTRDIGDDEHPDELPPIDLGAKILQITGGDLHSCALLANGTVLCWGDNEAGQLGQWEHTVIGAGADLANDYPHIQVLDGALIASIIAGTAHTCALRRDESVVCWGWNRHGQLGLGHHGSIGEETGDLTGPVLYRLELP